MQVIKLQFHLLDLLKYLGFTEQMYEVYIHVHVA